MKLHDTVGAYEAKTHLAAYLRHVQQGHRYTITQRGRPVAELLPYAVPQQQARQEAVAQMREFMASRLEDKPVDIRELIEHGRD